MRKFLNKTFIFSPLLITKLLRFCEMTVCVFKLLACLQNLALKFNYSLSVFLILSLKSTQLILLFWDFLYFLFSQYFFFFFKLDLIFRYLSLKLSLYIFKLFNFALQIVDVVLRFDTLSLLSIFEALNKLFEVVDFILFVASLLIEIFESCA